MVEDNEGDTIKLPGITSLIYHISVSIQVTYLYFLYT